LIALDAEVVNIALLGSDRRSNSSSFRTDVNIILSLNPNAGTAVLLSIPRDLYIYLPGYSMQRINTAFRIGDVIGYPGGGAAMFADAVRYNLGIPIHYFARVEMSGFKDIIDALNGVDVHVACSYTDWRLKSPDLDQNEPGNWTFFTTTPGIVHMDGDYALWYARSRARSSDFDRSRRQQEVLRAMYRQMLSLDVISRIPALYSELKEITTTDMGLSDLISLASLGTKIKLSKVSSRFIGRDEVTGWRVPITGASVLIPQPDKIQALLINAFSETERAEERSTTIEVVNASSNEAWTALASERMIFSGFEAISVRAEAEANAPTHLIDYGSASEQIGSDILSILGLSSSRLTKSPDSASTADFRLVIGEDYSPCFDPTRDQVDK
jgi:LCP family protein required for cell wall assembly